MPTTTKSLPTRECGLKSFKLIYSLVDLMSLPTRECGLKFPLRSDDMCRYMVTPYAGVWIEIYRM